MSTGILRKSMWVGAAILIVLAGIYFLRGPLGLKAFPPLPTSAVAPDVGDIPNVPEKQPPHSRPLDGCPPEGKGGDPQLNLLKNRIDRGDYANISFESLLTLTWPKNVERQPMEKWPEASRSFIDQYAGIPVEVEGYIVNIREGAPDASDCSWPNSSYLDWHLSFTANPRDARAQSVLAEVTPRVRLNHRWTMDAIHTLIMGDHMSVRLSGWLYFDPEHPGDLGITRSTLWEINPVMQIEVLDNTRWVPLDSLVH